jgi:hypothetical protein
MLSLAFSIDVGALGFILLIFFKWRQDANVGLWPLFGQRLWPCFRIKFLRSGCRAVLLARCSLCALVCERPVLLCVCFGDFVRVVILNVADCNRA